MRTTVKYLVTTMKRCLWILMVIGLSMAGCAKGGFSPGPQGPVGPQGDIGPQGTLGPRGDVGPKGNLGPSSRDLKKRTILIEDIGELVESKFPFSGFSKIEVNDFFTVEDRQGKTYRVTVEAEEAHTPYLDIFVRAKKLHIGLKSNHTYHFENASQRVEVTLPALTQAVVSNFSELRLVGMDIEDSMRLEVTDHSLLQGSVEAGNLIVEISDHSSLNLSGSASQVTGKVVNHGSADLSGLKAFKVDVDTDRFSTLSE